MNNGADVNAVDNKYEYTPLMYTVNYFREEIKSDGVTKLLLKYGADVNVVDARGHHILTTSAKRMIFSINQLANGYTFILEHIAILQAFNLPVDRTLIDYIAIVNDYISYLTQCVQELSTAKNMKLPNSWLTFFNLLTDDEYINSRSTLVMRI